MTVQERDIRDARLFADDALIEAKRVMATADTSPPGAYFMAVFTILAIGALCPDALADKAGTRA